MGGSHRATAGTRASFDRVAPLYDRTGVAFFEPIGRRLVEVAGVRAGERVLDVGCGRGAVLFAATEAVGPSGRVIGFDLAPAMVRLLREEVTGRELANVDVCVGDAEEPPVRSSSFDHWLASLVLPFVPDVGRAIAAAFDLLVPGGRIAFTTFGHGDARWDPLARLLNAAAGIDDPQEDDDADGSLGSAEGLAELLASAGFVEARIHEEPFRVVFDTPGRWLAWFRSTSGAGLLEQIPPERRDDAEARAMALVDGLRDDGGLIAMQVGVRTSIARRPV
jgi:O-methyltransferase/aklanonic acid methyltransferase